jgi:hypothetical protein
MDVTSFLRGRRIRSAEGDRRLIASGMRDTTNSRASLSHLKNLISEEVFKSESLVRDNKALAAH